MAALVWRAEALKSLFSSKKPLLTRETAIAAQNVVHFNNEKIKQYLPHFTYTPIEAVIEKTCAALKEKYQL
jgi:hypothetical protein